MTLDPVVPASGPAQAPLPAAVPPPVLLPPPLPSRRRRALKGLLIFFLGVVFGAFLVAGAAWHRFTQAMRNPSLGRERVFRWLDHMLDLDAAQEARVKEIVRVRQEELLNLRAAAVSDVDAVLTEAQRAKWRHFLERWKPR
ncbi:MAG: hypothetical protein AAB215_05265 [Planctomycetota bacterium]